MTIYHENDYSSATYTGGMLLPCECCGSRASVCRCHRIPRHCPGCDAWDAELAAWVARADQGDTA
jgi:hypothetical protein